jgi:integrase
MGALRNSLAPRRKPLARGTRVDPRFRRPRQAPAIAARGQAAPGSGINKKLTFGDHPQIGLKQARELADEAKAKLRAGRDPAAEKAQTLAKAKAGPATDELVEGVVELYLRRHAIPNTRERSARETKRILTVELEPWRGRRLADIKRKDVFLLLDGAVDRGAPSAAAQLLAHLKGLFNWAIGRGIVEANPCALVKPPVAPKSRARVLSDAEVVRVWRAADQAGRFGALVRLLLLTGCRRSELANAKWSEIDMEGRVFSLPAERSKNGQAHSVPLSDLAMATLAGIKSEGGAPFIFSSDRGRSPVKNFDLPKRRFDRLIAEIAGEPIPHFTLHDIRRSCASSMAGLGIAPHIVEAVLNHRSGAISRVAGVYNRFDYAGEKRVALARWADHISAIVAGRRDDNVVEFASANAEK